MSLATLLLLSSAFLALLFVRRGLSRRPSILLLLFAAVLTLHTVPTLVYLHVTGPDTFVYEAALQNVAATEVQARMLLALSCMFVLLVLGALSAPMIAPRAWSARGRPLARDGARFVYDLRGPVRHALWLLAACMLAVILVEDQPAKIYNYFASGESELERIFLRREDGGTRFYLYNVYLSSLAPFIVLMLYCARRATPKDRELTMLFAVFFVLVLVGKLGMLSKAPPVIFLIQLALLRPLLSTGMLSLWSGFKLTVMLLLLLVVTVKVTIPDLDLQAVFRFLYYRIFDIPNEALLEYFAAFPQTLRHGWEYGPLGGAHRPPGHEVLANYLAVSEIVRGDITSSSNVMFVGDAWANYSWLGVIFTSYCVGVYLRLVDLYAFRQGRTDEWACINASCFYGVFTMLSTAFPTALITGGLLTIPLLSMLLVKKAPRPSPRPRTNAPQDPL